MIQRFRRWLWRWLSGGARPDIGTTIALDRVRVRFVGGEVVSKYGATLRLVPVVEPGRYYPPQDEPTRARFRGPDRFVRFDMTLTLDGDSVGFGRSSGGHVTKLADARIVSALLDGDVILEGWQKHIVGSGQDAEHPWIQYAFVHTQWTVVSADRRTFLGVANAGESVLVAVPDGQAVGHFAFWKTAEQPPEANVVRL